MNLHGTPKSVTKQKVVTTGGSFHMKLVTLKYKYIQGMVHGLCTSEVS